MRAFLLNHWSNQIGVAINGCIKTLVALFAAVGRKRCGSTRTWFVALDRAFHPHHFRQAFLTVVVTPFKVIPDANGFVGAICSERYRRYRSGCRCRRRGNGGGYTEFLRNALAHDWAVSLYKPFQKFVKAKFWFVKSKRRPASLADLNVVDFTIFFNCSRSRSRCGGSTSLVFSDLASAWASGRIIVV